MYRLVLIDNNSVELANDNSVDENLIRSGDKIRVLYRGREHVGTAQWMDTIVYGLGWYLATENFYETILLEPGMCIERIKENL